MSDTQINHLNENVFQITMELSNDIEFVEIYYKYNLLKKIEIEKKSFLSKIFNISNTLNADINTFFIPNKSEIEVIGFSKKKSLHKMVDFKIETTRNKEISLNETKLSPIIFTALGRSGTTYFMNLLANVDEIVSDKTYPLENRFASNLYEDISTYSTEIMNDRFDMISHLNNIKHKVDNNFINLSKKYNKNNPKYFVEKSMRPFYIIDSIYPKSKNIFLVRNFKDTVASSLNFNKKRGNLRFGREHVDDDMKYIEFKSKQARKWIYEPYIENKENSLVVKYEDLIQNTEFELSRVLDFLELDTSSRNIKKIINMTKEDSKSYSFHKTRNDNNSNSKFINSKYSLEQINSKINIEFKYLFEEFGY